MIGKDVSATVPSCNICEEDLIYMRRPDAQKNANGMRRIDAGTVPGQIAQPDYERTILAR